MERSKGAKRAYRWQRCRLREGEGAGHQLKRRSPAAPSARSKSLDRGDSLEQPIAPSCLDLHPGRGFPAGVTRPHMTNAAGIPLRPLIGQLPIFLQAWG